MQSNAGLFSAMAFCIFAALGVNVVLGAFWSARFLSDAIEMLTLGLTSALFVVAIPFFEQTRQDPTDT